MKIPLKEMLGSIPGVLGIRLEEEPNYEVSLKDGAFEIRRYDEMVLAQTTVAGTHEQAMDESFEILADYIFGGNHERQTMSMTTPVLQEKSGAQGSKTMSMTTPVLQKKTQESGSDAWTMSFVLEKDYSEATAPVPNSSRVKLATVPAKTYAVYRYSGNNTEEQVYEAEQKLRAWVQAKGEKIVGETQWAQYDQPFAIPMLKRNEAFIEIA